MATTPPMIGGADPSVLRSLETQTPSIARTSPPTVSATTGSATSGGTAIARSIAPQVSGDTITYNQATQTVSGASLTITSATSNEPADVVTVFNSNKAISVSAVNQTVNSYNVNNYSGNEYTDSDVANYLPTFTGNVGAGNVNVTGTVYTSGISSTALASLTILNVSTTANLGAVGGVIITGGSNGQVLTTNGSNVLSWTTVSGGNGSYSNNDVANYLPTFTGNIGANVVTANLFVGSGANLTNIAGANVGGFVPNANIANTAFAVAGANVSGFVPNANIANTAFAVAAANVSGLGNIATINLNGNNQTWLAGNGVFANIAIPTVGNIAVINLDGNVSNLLTGTGTFVAIPTVPTVGNIAVINLDGNASNVLRGNGTWSADATSSYGDSNVTTLLGAFGSNTITTTGNVSVGNIIGNGQALTGLAGGNVSGQVGNALVAGTVYTNAQPNITSVGTLTSLSVTGNANVGNLGTATAIITTGNITTINSGLLQNGNSNITITTNGNISLSAVGSPDEVVITSTGVNVAGTLSVTGNVTGGNISTTGNISGNTNGFSIGYLNIPQVSAANATLALTDAGKHYYSTTAGNITLTVPLNSSVAFSTGTAVSIVVQAAGNVLVNAAAGVTLYMGGNATAGNRVVGTYGMATLMKVASDTWFISGAGVA
jgi:hypothetical protein